MNVLHSTSARVRAFSFAVLSLPFGACARPPAAAPATVLVATDPVRETRAARTEVMTPVAAPLERALATISPDEIRADLEFIASDELAGRDTPSDGLRVAARFIRARMQRLGFEPGAKDGWFHTYPLTQSRLDFAACGASAKAGEQDVELLFGADYFLATENDVFASDVTAPAVWCGAASDADLERANPKGKWAVCADDGDQGFRLYRRVRSAGAAGLVLVEPAQGSRAYATRFGRMDALRRGDVELALDRIKTNENKAGEADSSRASSRSERVPRVWLTRGAFARVLRAGGKTEESLAPGTELGFTFTERRALVGQPTIDVENVCAFWPGNDPALSNEVILVTAHYDHVGVRNGKIYNGADDNGSGTCGMLALAEALREYGPLRRSVMLMWMSGEEKGLWGSQAWNENPWLPGGRRALCDLNIDMIGRNAPDQLLVTPTSEHRAHNALVRLTERLAPLEGFPKLGDADKYYERSDHYNFAKHGIPAAFLFSGVHADYHQPEDDVEKIDYDKIRRVVRLVLRTLTELQQDSTGL